MVIYSSSSGHGLAHWSEPNYCRLLDLYWSDAMRMRLLRKDIQLRIHVVRVISSQPHSGIEKSMWIICLFFKYTA